MRLSAKLERISVATVLAFLFFFFSHLTLWGQEKKTILFLDSYHPGYLWSEDIKAGLYEYLSHDAPEYNLYIEYMDTKKYDSADIFPLLFQSFSRKYTQHKPDIILSSDNNALRFLTRYRDMLFPKTPVVFCGVNHFNDRMLAGFSHVTGVVEEPSFKETIQLALKLFPKTKHIYGIGGSAETATVNLKGISQAFKDNNFGTSLSILHNLTKQEYKQALEKIPEDSLLLYVGLYRDAQGETFSGARESLAFIRQYTERPVFSMWSQHLAFCLGGVMISGREQSRNAAMMALSIVHGTKVEDIPLMRESPNRPMFNYEELRRFGIGENQLPENSIVIHRPPSSFYSHYKKEIWAITGVFLITTLLLISFLLTLSSRNIALQRQNRLGNYINNIQDSMPSAIIAVDLSLKITQWNCSAGSLSGVEKADAIGKPLEDIYPLLQRNVQQVQEAILAQKELVVLNLPNQREGKDIFEDVTVYPLVSEDEPGAVIRIDDVSERVRLDELRQQSEVLKDQLVQSQKMESVGRLAGGIAHDFNNMLSIILGNAEMLIQDMSLQHGSIGPVLEIQKAAERSANLTRQLLAFARKQPVTPQIINLNDAIEGMLKMISRLIGEDITLEWHPEHELWPVKIDPSQIDQMLANLCVNARDSIENVGRVTIATANIHCDAASCSLSQEALPGDYVLVCVSDTGCGMNEETIDSIFEPFFTTKKLGEGTGLGLSTVYGIIQQNKGFILVESERGRGTTFRLHLPRVTDEQIKQSASLQSVAQTGTETVLLVEDEEPILRMTQMMLERMGYNVLSANTPEDALRICQRPGIQVQLLLTDVVMPGMNGRELSEKVMALFPSIKCLFISGYTADVIATRGALDEGLNFLSKPFTRQELSGKVRELLDQKG